MFSREGSARSDRQNRRLAGYLALVAGFVNSSGFVLIGSFTSHTTGNVGRFANDLALGQYAAASAALAMIVCFFGGALGASMMIESRVFGGGSRPYACALGAEAVLLATFTLLSYVTVKAHPRVRDTEALLLCGAMGMQNALVTRLSGAVVRTTHLTGVITDLGIECARWLRYWLSTLSQATHLPSILGSNAAPRPAVEKSLLLLTITFAFLLGGVLGATLTVRIHHLSMLLAAVAVLSGAIYALRDRPATAALEPAARR